MDHLSDQPKNNPLVKWLHLDNEQAKTELDSLPDYELEVLVTDLTEFLLKVREITFEGTDEERDAFLHEYSLNNATELVEITTRGIPMIINIIKEKIGSDRIKTLSNKTFDRLKE